MNILNAIQGMRVYLDTNIWIYTWEEYPTFVTDLRELFQIYGRVLGFGLTNDGYHDTAPELGGKRAIAAVKQCLERSGLERADIDYIHAHGTSTRE